MKTILTIFAAVLATAAFSQDPDSFERKLDPFSKVIVSPKIDLVLIPGNTESVRIQYTGVDLENIIIDQSGKRLHIYLDHARIYDIGERRRNKNMFHRRERYRHAHVTAYVTYNNLKLVEIRGEGNVICEGKILTKRFKIRAYGENNVRIDHLEAATVKARLYGENMMTILSGDAGHLSYKMYGENKINTRGMTSITSNATIYGEGKVSLYASEELRVNSFGEPSLFVSGSPYISKGIMFGHANIRRR